MFEFIFTVIGVCCAVSHLFLILKNKTYICKYFDERNYRKYLEERCEELLKENCKLKESNNAR